MVQCPIAILDKDLGPGILIGLDNHDETPEFGGGIKFTIPL